MIRISSGPLPELARRWETPLFEEKVASPRFVTIAEDASDYFGFSAVLAGALPEELAAGNTFTLDFGRHCVGKFAFRLSDCGTFLDAPVQIKFRFAELPYELGRDFSGYHGYLCPSWLQEETVNADGAGDYTLPRRYAYRYVEVTVLATPQKMRLSDFTAICQTGADVSRFTPLPEGTPEDLCRMDEISAATLRDCMQKFFEDGPKRDRRLWSGDLRLQVLADRVLFRNDDMVRRCLCLFAACEEPGEYLPACLYQDGGICYNKGDAIMDYAMAWCCTLIDYWNDRKDRELMAALYPTLCRQIGVALSHIGKDGILTPNEDWGGGFLDWAEGLRHVTGTHGCLLYTLAKAIPVAEEWGDPDTAALWTAALADGRRAAKEKLFDGEKCAFVNAYDGGQYSIQSQIWMVLGGVVSGDLGTAVLRRAENDKNCLQAVTPLAKHYLVEAWLMLGEKQEALSRIRAFWGKMAAYGADTYWELFEDGNPALAPYGDNLIHSACHAWGCSVSYFIRRYFV